VERKLVTIVFVDLVGSTELVTSTDPEVARARVGAFLGQVRDCIESHGGTVGRFAGDAIMAAFGVPQAHEDDAERAVRAGLAVLDSVADLELDARIGVESGEVLTDEDDITFATGEPVNVAVRLQQEAAPGQLVLGPGAQRLTADRVESQPLGELELKGIERPIAAWRATSVLDGQPARRAAVAAPLVGRREEIDLLANTFERVVRDRRAHLFTVYGEPGVGKTRLVHEFVGGLEGATVLAGRCLPYGESITYWPLAEMVKSAAGISDDDPVKEAVDKLRATCEDEAVADLLGLASGVLSAVEDERSGQEIAWALRAWAEQLARVQPLVLVFEDLHWAEEPLLELVVHLAERVRDAPLLIVCVARAELLDVRPSWGGGRLRATAIELEPLPPEQTDELVDALLAGNDVSPELRAQLLEKTGGNPLFVEETIRMLAEQGGGGAVERIPDTVQALIAARIDRLPAPEKAALQRAALIGRVFWPGAVAELSPAADDGVDGAIDGLVLRDFVLREERSSISGEAAYRFKHVLIREVAYGGLAKSVRAELHERFAAWLAERAGAELLEVRAYHLDHAAALRAELDGSPPAELAADAAAALEQAGKRALAREANRSARNLLLRAVELEPTLRRRFEAARAASKLGDLGTLAYEMERVRTDAREAGERAIEGRAATALAEVALYRDGDALAVAKLAKEALAVLPEDEVDGRFEALIALYDSAWFPGDLEQAEEHLAAALELAQRSGREDLSVFPVGRLSWIAGMRLDFERAEQLVERGLALAEETSSVLSLARARFSLGALRRIQGRLDEAEAALEEARRLFGEIDSAAMATWCGTFLAWIAWVKGDASRAERLAREGIRVFASLGDRGFLCEAQRALAELLLARGKVEEAERYALASRETVSAGDRTSLGTTMTTLGLVRAAQGRDREAEELLREALAVYEGTEFRLLEAEPRTALAQFLHERGRDEEAGAVEERLPSPVPGWLGRADARSAALVA
jgi:class 3 adenylate cyclase